MKKYALWFTLGLVIVACVGMVVTQTHNLYILNSDDGEIKIKIRAAASQTAPFIECVKGGTNVFSVAANGTVTPALFSGITASYTNTMTDGSSNRFMFFNGVLTNVTSLVP